MLLTRRIRLEIAPMSKGGSICFANWGGYQLIDKMRAVEKWLSPYEHAAPYRYNALLRPWESWLQRRAVGHRRERQSAIEMQAPNRPFPGAGLLLSGV